MGSGQSNNQNPQLKEFCQKVSQIYTDFQQQNQISEDKFAQKFPNRKIFAIYLLKYILRLKQNKQNFYDAFELFCQILLLNEENIQNDEYKNHGMNIFEILIQISRQQKLKEKQAIKKKEIIQINKFFSSLIFTDKSNLQEKDTFKNILEELFQDKEQIHFEIVQQKFKNLFPVLMIFLRNLIEKLIFQQQINEENFEQDNLMNNETFLLLQMCNSKLWNYPQKQLIYSSIRQGSSFHRLAQSLKGLQCPVIILIQNKYNTIKAQNNIGIFGAMTTCEWNDSLAYFGNPETFLFSVNPKFKTFFTFNGKGGKNYIYLNTRKINNSEYNVGLGFGGENNEFHRIWIDSNFLKQSKIYDYGNTFAEGQISDSPDEYLQIVQIEVWGFPSQQDLKQQEQFRENENQRIMNSRKIDKKQMFGMGAELLMEKQFKFKEQLNIDFDYEKEQMNKQNQLSIFNIFSYKFFIQFSFTKYLYFFCNAFKNLSKL